MQYKDFSERGLFVGSGVIEAACKNVIGKRLTIGDDVERFRRK